MDSKTSGFDAIVLGMGGMGSAALYHLARRGVRALGLDQFGIPHDRGSSHGDTRIIRRSYYEHPDYVPLVDRSFALWSDLEKESGESLLERTGLLLAGPPDGEVIPGVRRAAQQHRLAIEELSTPAAAARFPLFHYPQTNCVLFEADAGQLYVEKCVSTHVRRAVALGATVKTNERVCDWSVEDNGVVVSTETDQLRASRLVLCAGAWSGVSLRPFKLPLTVRRKVVLWLKTSDPRYRKAQGCPIFGFEVDGGLFYGFPSLDGQTVKVAEHTGDEEPMDPDRLDRLLRESDTHRVLGFVGDFLPGVTSTVVRHSVCMYTMTPDSHFIVDRHPEHSNVFIAAGFSGHGFKFAPVVGQALADLVIDREPSSDIAFLSVGRLLPRANKSL